MKNMILPAAKPRIQLVLLAASLLLLLSPRPAQAVPASPNPFRLTQPDGSEITLRVFGDEWFHWYETMDGRPVTLDQGSGFWMYSLPSDTGPNVSSGRRAEIDAPPAPPWQPRPSVAKQTAIQKARVSAHPHYVNSSGTGLVPVILGNFSDTTPAVTAATLKTMLFSTAKGSNSMANFYKEVSYGKFTVSAGASGVQDWVTVSHPTTYYATNTVVSSQNANDGPQADMFVQDAVLAAVAAGYDFSPYAQGGKVPVVCVVHAGYGEESGGGPGTIWSHRGTLSGSLGASGPVTVKTANGPIVIDAYIIEPETQPQALPAKGADVVGIGVFCHEYGHALGLPDLYDTTYASLGIGSWSVMAYGSYNQILRAGDCPAHFDAWCKAKLGWISPVNYTLNYQNVQFPAAATTPFAAKMWKDGQAGQQYYLVENRYNTGFDTGLPSPGLLIWHIDETKGGDISVWNRDNTQTWYPISFTGSPADTNNGNFHVELMQADNLWQLNVTNKVLKSVGDPGDPFPGSTHNRVFGPNTAPNSQAYNVGLTPGYNSFVTVSNISDPGMTMTADLYTRSPNSGPLANWVNIGGVVPPFSGSQFSSLSAQNPVVINATPGISGATLSQAQLYINRSSDGLWWDFTNQKWGTNTISSNYNMSGAEQRGLTLAFVDNLPDGTNLLNGAYQFTVRVIDSAGVPTELDLSMTAVHAPQVSLSLLDNSVVNTLTNTFTAVATENTGLGIQSVQFALYWDSAGTEGGPAVRWFWNGTAWTTAPTWLGSTYPAHPPQVTEYYPIGPDANNLLTEKQYTIEARAVDGFGDAVTNAISVFYDPGAPGTIYWRYSASGDWFNPANWNPGRVPAPTDCVVVNQPGDYTVTIDGSASANSLRFGRVVGINLQHLAITSGSLTIGGTDTNKLYANGTLDMGANLTMGVVQLSPGAAWNWTNGAIYGAVNIPADSVLTANEPGGVLQAFGPINNAGAFVLAGGDVQFVGAGDGYSGELINLPGGLVDFQGDSSIDNYSGEVFMNQGLVRKSGGTGVSLINTAFQSTGISDVETGTISFVGGGTLAGAQFTGPGVNLLAAGNFALAGTVNASNVVLGGSPGASLTGTNAVLSGMWTWTNGLIAGASTLTLQSNSVLTLAGVAGLDYGLYSPLTNAGTIRLVSGNLQVIGAGDGYTGELINLAGGLVDFQADVSIDNYSGDIFINQGVVRKSGGSGVSVIKPAFTNTGTLDVRTGTLTLAGGGGGNGQFLAEAGTTLDISGGYEMDNASVTGPGTNVLSGGTVYVNGSLNTAQVVLAGAALGGTNGVIRTDVTWTSGTIAPFSTLTVATNAILTLAGTTNTDYGVYGALTNAGIIRLASGNLQIIGSGDGYTGELINLPGALVDFLADVSIDDYSADLFINQGTVRKSGGTGLSQINAVFLSTGLSDAETGTLSLQGGGTLTGARLTGAGTNLLYAGNYVLAGTVNASNAVLGGGSGTSLTGANAVLSGVWTWTNGVIAGGSTFTLQTNSVLTLAGVAGTDYGLYSPLTNSGTIRLVSGNLQVIGPADGYTGELINLPNGLVDFQADVSIDNYSGDLFLNQGTVRKSGGSGVSTIKPAFDNTGTLEIRIGTINLAGGGGGSGQYLTESGAALDISGGYEMDNASVTGNGTNILSGGTVYLDGSIYTSQVILAGASLGGTNAVIRTEVTWTSGLIAPGTTLTVATNGILTLAGATNTDFGVYGIVTNAGTIRLVSGNLQLIGPADGYTGELINLPGALVDLQGDVSIDTYSGELFINQGTVRKSGGTGVSLFKPVLENTGVLDTETGTISLVGGGTATDARLTGSGTNQFTAGNYALHGTVLSSNAFLAGATFTGSNAFLQGTWTWQSGVLDGQSDFTIATNGILVLAGTTNTDYGLYGPLTNAGTIRLVSGNLQVIGPADGYTGELINLSSGLVDIQSDVSIHDYSGDLIINQGVVRKSGGTGVSLIKPVFENTGTLDVQTGTVAFGDGYDLKGGALNFGLSSPTNFGQVVFPAAANLAGSLSANLNNGYSPVLGSSFPVLTYGSTSGAFDNLELPAGISWQSNYGATEFTLSVLTAAPLSIQTQPTNITVNAGQDATFSVTASGNAPLGYQWLFDGTNIPGATASSLIITSAQTTQAGLYNVVVSNASGSITSSNALLTVLSVTPLAIQTQPVSETVNAGQTATFTVTATGNAPLGYQWFFGAASIPGATASSLILTNVQASQAGLYDVVVTNASGSITSSNALLTVLSVTPLTIQTQPTDDTVNVGQSATFTVTATGNAPLGYQWLFNGTNIAGAAASSLVLTNVQLSQAGLYDVVVSNASGSITSSNALLTVLSVIPLAIQTEPTNETVNAGQSATFSVTASGKGPIGYQWFFNGTNISGATASTLVLTNVQPSEAGLYDVVVTNASGSVTSSNALLTVVSQPAGPKLGIVVISGQTATISFQSQLDATYILEYKNALTDPVWTPLPPAPGNGGLLQISDPGPLPPMRFYRLMVQ